MNLLTWRQLKEHSRATIVATNGCFDILHVGHLQLLEQASQYGDLLVVGLNSDKSIRQLKGPKRPINCEENRKKILLAFRMVSFVHIFNGKRAVEFLKLCRPHVYVKSDDYSLDTLDPKERAVLKKMNTKIVFSPLIKGESTTRIVSKL